MLLSHKTSIKISQEYSNIIGHMCYAASKLWNICNNEPDPAKRKDTYYPDPEISNEAQKEIQRIIWKEKARQKKTQSN